MALHAIHPETGDRMGTLTYKVPRRKADKIHIDRLETHEDHQRKGVGSALMDELQRRHPGTPIDHGDRTDAGKAWWNGYTDGKKVTRGRTMAARTAGMTWDVPDEVTSTIHRGLTLALSPEDHAHVHDRTIPARKRAAHVVNLASARGGIGRHWSTDEDMAHHFSHTGAVDLLHHPHLLSVTLHAHPPQPEHIERDPAELQRMGVQGHIAEKEIPLTKDAPVRIGGVSWQDTRDSSQNHRFVAPGARGIIRQAFETPVPDNTAPYEHHHDWLPHDHFFAPGKPDLDDRLFEGDHMHPEVRQHLLGLLNGFWAPRYGDSWQSWARVYLAGSEASHFYGNGDLDILIGIDYEAARAHTGLGDEAEIDTHLTDELRKNLNDDQRMLPGPDGKTGPWENTWYVNPDSYDIRKIKPYAAYDITRDEWAVRPVEVPDDFDAEKLPEATWDVFDALQTLIKAIAELPEGTREREGAALYDYLHADRHSAFGPDGTGLYDPANAVWKALDKAPDAPLQQLIDWKHAHDGATATAQENEA
ncbi:GNAT family N-acetyltransferase [Streptomyces sp. NPDC059761]|uniref:GNAT family N-acetyltransferase n=1 Tax=Streptomyces sp. NPDC059761 TaxID=3346937 RepID=UPI003652CBF6